MRRFILLVIACAATALAQHTATLTWVDGVNPFGVTYNVFRAAGACAPTTVFAQTAAAISTLTYVDSTIGTGAYGYAVSAVVGGVESAKSNYAQAQVGTAPTIPAAPTGLTVIAK